MTSFFSFICKRMGGKITLNDEADKIEFFDIEQLPPNTLPKQVERIQDSIAYPDRTIYRTQTGKTAIELLGEHKK